MFFSKFEVSEETQLWVMANFDWAIEQELLTPQMPLVLPTKEFFTAGKGNSPEVVLTLVKDIQRQLKIDGAQIDVAPLNRLPAEYRHEYQSTSEVGGTWQGDENGGTISYDPERANEPMSFISTLVHEVMHHRLHMIEEYPPGGPEAEEIATDLHCITTGFGIFQLAGAETAGWQGYLRQPTRAYALSVFLAIRGMDLETCFEFLPSRSRKLLKRSSKELAKHFEVIEELRLKLERSRKN